MGLMSGRERFLNIYCPCVTVALRFQLLCIYYFQQGHDIINDMNFEWDPKKAASNLQKHKVSFEEAATALSDSMSATGADPGHSIAENRYVTFGVPERGRLLVVAHTDEGVTIRIISARLASKGERKIYEEG